MNRHFCTLFDKGFLARGMALHESLVNQCPDFTLWMMCNDDEAFDMLTKLTLKNVRLLRMTDVADERVKATKSSRTISEYCWMFSSVLPLYILEHNPALEMITYLDADLYFYSPFEHIYEQFGQSSIMIIPHAYSDNQIHLQAHNGIYNVGMMIFRNDASGLECLRWWKERVIEWCFARYEDGKMGDQLYLNDWPSRFKNVFILNDPGSNVASWNVDRFRFTDKNGKLTGTVKKTGSEFPLVFFHFHGLRVYFNHYEHLKAYPITVYSLPVYKVYVSALQRAYGTIRTYSTGWSFGTVKKLDILRVIKQYITICLKGYL